MGRWPKDILSDINLIDSKIALYSKPDGDCILWTGKKCKDGYGRLHTNGKTYLVHRVSLVKKLGRNLLPGECACHSCDNPSCINPDHLWAGTIKENNLDAISKGRINLSKIALSSRGYKNGKEDGKCVRGHILTDNNTYIAKNGSVICRKCRSITWKSNNLKKKLK